MLLLPLEERWRGGEETRERGEGADSSEGVGGAPASGFGTASSQFHTWNIFSADGVFRPTGSSRGILVLLFCKGGEQLYLHADTESLSVA